jgi:hypothetical protein
MTVQRSQFDDHIQSLALFSSSTGGFLEVVGEESPYPE